MVRNHKVQFRSEESIAGEAKYYRSIRKDSSLGHYFSITQFIANELREALKIPLNIEIFEPELGDNSDPAWVQFDDSLTLFVQSGIWRSAARGDPQSVYKLAHEIGHLVLHDKSAKAFSYPEHQKTFLWPKEETAEWQANAFADYFLCPDEVVRRISDPETLATICNIDRELAEFRIHQFEKSSKNITPSFIGEPCGNCHNFTVTRMGLSVCCKTCGEIGVAV